MARIFGIVFVLSMVAFVALLSWATPDQKEDADLRQWRLREEYTPRAPQDVTLRTDVREQPTTPVEDVLQQDREDLLRYRRALKRAAAQRGSSVAEGGDLEIRARSGDSLRSLARVFMGDSRRWRDLLDHNPALSSSGRLDPGQRVVIPARLRR